MRAIVVGCGLAGMVVASELRKRGVTVTVLEASDRAGGKAGADAAGGFCEEHGYHVFPGWYRNTRALLRDLGVIGNLIDIDRFHHLRRGRFPEFDTYHSLTSPGALRHNLLHGILTTPQTVVSFFFGVDLAAQPFRRSGFLDRVSANGFLRSRFYASDPIANFHQQTVLQASSIPTYDVSAMTTQKLVQCWLGTPEPFLSILNGNLQDKFVVPLLSRLRAQGVLVRMNSAVRRLEVRDDRIAAVELDGGERIAGDVFVLTTPHAVTHGFVDAEVYAAEDRQAAFKPDRTRLADLVHLESAPMAALNVYFRRKIPDIPKEHVNLYLSRYGTSFIDVSQHWEGLPNTALCMIAANFASLSMLPEDEMARALIRELLLYVPTIGWEDVERWCMLPNVDAPLFLNTVSSWSNRPGARTLVDNLYTAGDYCRSDADLTTMESAIMCALSAAGAILEDGGLEEGFGPRPLVLPSRGTLRLLKYAGLFLVLPIGACYWLRRIWEDFRESGEF
jgi:glycine/D-amino acid oxidase-like deaminating enzyme